MDITGKMGYAAQLVENIAAHDDAPAAEVVAALDDLRALCQARIDTLDADRANRAAAAEQ